METIMAKIEDGEFALRWIHAEYHGESEYFVERWNDERRQWIPETPFASRRDAVRDYQEALQAADENAKIEAVYLETQALYRELEAS